MYEWIQILLIIIIIIIAVIIIIYIIRLFNLKNVIKLPFADGTIIRIKSLQNNKYLIPVQANDIPLECPSFTALFNLNYVMASGIESTPEAEWKLCQWFDSGNSGKSGYLVINNINDTISMSIPRPANIINGSPRPLSFIMNISCSNGKDGSIPLPSQNEPSSIIGFEQIRIGNNLGSPNSNIFAMVSVSNKSHKITSSWVGGLPSVSSNTSDTPGTCSPYFFAITDLTLDPMLEGFAIEVVR